LFRKSNAEIVKTVNEFQSSLLFTDFYNILVLEIKIVTSNESVEIIVSLYTLSSTQLYLHSPVCFQRFYVTIQQMKIYLVTFLFDRL